MVLTDLAPAVAGRLALTRRSCGTSPGSASPPATRSQCACHYAVKWTGFVSDRRTDNCGHP